MSTDTNAARAAEILRPDPECPDCLGEGVNVYSFDPPLAYPCRCTFTPEELRALLDRRPAAQPEPVTPAREGE